MTAYGTGFEHNTTLELNVMVLCRIANPLSMATNESSTICNLFRLGKEHVLLSGGKLFLTASRPGHLALFKRPGNLVRPPPSSPPPDVVAVACVPFVVKKLKHCKQHAMTELDGTLESVFSKEDVVQMLANVKACMATPEPHFSTCHRHRLAAYT
jgi:hypothetical protein